jgi:hypothetical protein
MFCILTVSMGMDSLQSVSGEKQSNKNLTVSISRSNNIPSLEQIFTTNYMVIRGKCVTEWRNCRAQLWYLKAHITIAFVYY